MRFGIEKHTAKILPHLHEPIPSLPVLLQVLLDLLVIFPGHIGIGFLYNPSQVRASNDVPTMLYTPAQLRSTPFELSMGGVNADSLIVEAYVGPYTSIGAGARIEGTEIERSIVSPGASVTHVGGRLVASLIGCDARVFRDFSLPRAMRLRVGDGDEIALC